VGEQLRSLKVSDVESIRVHILDLDEARGKDATMLLNQEQIEKFLALIRDATTHLPNHPSTTWTCYVEIQTKKPASSNLRFQVKGSKNDGIHVRLSSDGGPGWNYGTWRNDDLEKWMREVFAASN
jgi:hypothetical protein